MRKDHSLTTHEITNIQTATTHSLKELKTYLSDVLALLDDKTKKRIELSNEKALLFQSLHIEVKVELSKRERKVDGAVN